MSKKMLTELIETLPQSIPDYERFFGRAISPYYDRLRIKNETNHSSSIFPSLAAASLETYVMFEGKGA